MTRDDFFKEFSECLQQDLPNLTGEESLESMPEWDSLAFVVLLAHLDKAYGVTVPTTEIRSAMTVNDLCSMVVKTVNDCGIAHRAEIT